MEQNVSIEEVLNNSFSTIYDVLKLIDSNVNDIVIAELNNNANADEILRLKQFNEAYIDVMRKTKSLQGDIGSLFEYINKDINDIKQIEVASEQELAQQMVKEVQPEQVSSEAVQEAVQPEQAMSEELVQEVEPEQIITEDVVVQQDTDSVNNIEVSNDTESVVDSTDDIKEDDNSGFIPKINTASLNDSMDVENNDVVEETTEINNEENIPKEENSGVAEETSTEETAESTNEKTAPEEENSEVAEETSTEETAEPANEEATPEEERNEVAEETSVEETAESTNEEATPEEETNEVAAEPTNEETTSEEENSEVVAETNAEEAVPEGESNETGENVIPDISFNNEMDNAVLPTINVPNLSDSSETTDETSNKSVDNVNDGILRLTRISNETPRVILVTKSQFDKLRQSLSSKKALLSAKGLFLNDENLEDQLVQSGLLEGSVEDMQQQIQQLITEAQELYKEGKSEEAQTKMSLVAELNEKIKNSSQQVTTMTA